MLAISFGDSLIKVVYIVSGVKNVIFDRIIVLLLSVFNAKIRDK